MEINEVEIRYKLLELAEKLHWIKNDSNSFFATLDRLTDYVFKGQHWLCDDKFSTQKRNCPQVSDS